jgi:hypothetical protein
MLILRRDIVILTVTRPAAGGTVGQAGIAASVSEEAAGAASAVAARGGMASTGTAGSSGSVAASLMDVLEAAAVTSGVVLPDMLAAGDGTRASTSAVSMRSFDISIA